MTSTRRRYVESVGAGFLASSVMSLTTLTEERRRGPVDHVIDYDASRHVATAVGTVLRRPARGHRERQGYFVLAHWGYGSMVAAAYRPLRQRLGSDAAAGLTFFVGCEAMAMVLLPALGGTPEPWRWRRDVLATSLAQHAVYTVVVVAAHRALDLHGADARPPVAAALAVATTHGAEAAGR